MKKIIFEDLIEKQKATKKWLFLPVSLIFHAIAIAALVVAPLLNAVNKLPPIKTIEIMMVSPSTLSMPVGRGDASGTRNRAGAEPGSINRKPPKPVREAVLTEPVKIPDTIDISDDFDFVPNAGDGDGFVSGALGHPDGVPGAPFLPGDNIPKNVAPRRIGVGQIPKLIKKVTPAYPELAIKTRTYGTVVIEAETDIYGRVIHAKVISGKPLLNRAALEAIKKWIYEPYIINGFPRPVRFSVTLSFTLKRK